MRIVVTGATGFVGRTVCPVLAERGYEVRAAVRAGSTLAGHIPECVVVGDIGPGTIWDEALQGVDCVLHLAARAHVLNDAPENARLYFETNQHGTETLARAAARAGVRRFVFLSSIKVNGEESRLRAYAATDEPHPQDAYGKSKWLAEQAVRAAAGQSGMQAVIVRPPLVYGPGVRANFLRLMRWVDARRPLPVAAIDNRRSLVSVWTLCDLLATLLEHPAAPGTWMVSDGEDLSTPDLIRRIGRAMGRPARLVAAPVGLLVALGGILGKKAEVARLCGSLVVDITPTRAQLGWSPPLSVDEAVQRTVAWYLAEGRSRGT
jgi:nucleoside-diphosphate-sugar epimerase